MMQVGGVFVFDSKENLAAFKNSDLVKSTSEAYKFVETTETQVLSIANVIYEHECPLVT